MNTEETWSVPENTNFTIEWSDGSREHKLNVREMKLTQSDIREPVEYTARVLATSQDEAAQRRSPSLADIKKAARRAGVDENTEFTIEKPELNMAKRTLDTYVVFKWEV